VQANFFGQTRWLVRGGVPLVMTRRAALEHPPGSAAFWSLYRSPSSSVVPAMCIWPAPAQQRDDQSSVQHIKPNSPSRLDVRLSREVVKTARTLSPPVGRLYNNVLPHDKKLISSITPHPTPSGPQKASSQSQAY